MVPSSRSSTPYSPFAVHGLHAGSSTISRAGSFGLGEVRVHIIDKIVMPIACLKPSSAGVGPSLRRSMM